MPLRGTYYCCLLYNETTGKVEADGFYTSEELDRMNESLEGNKKWHITEDWERKYNKKYNGVE